MDNSTGLSIRKPLSGTSSNNSRGAAEISSIQNWDQNGTTTQPQKVDHDTMLLNRRLTLARSKLKETNYESAAKLYVKCLEEIKKIRGFSDEGRRGIQFELFQAYKGQAKHEECLQVLQSLTAESQGQNLSGDTNRINHLKGEVHLLMHNPEKALPFALEAMKGRYALLGSEDRSYVQSSNLVADIYDSLGDPEEEELYRMPMLDDGEYIGNEHDATASGGEDLFKLLAKNNLKLDTPVEAHKVLCWAIRKRNRRAFDLAIKSRAVLHDLAQTRDDPNSPLMEAAEVGSVVFIELLLRHGANVNGDFSDRVPLIVAVLAGQAGAVACLLDHGASPNPRDRSNRTPLRIARAGNLRKIEEILRKVGGQE